VTAFDQVWDELTEAFFKYAADDRPPTICVDLDGTLAEEDGEFDPKVIGKPRRGARKWMEKLHEAGARLIIWTVRGDKHLVNEWLDEYQIPFDYINENPDQPKDSSGKVVADVYLDNRAVDGSSPWSRFGPELLDKVKAE
jgi:hydroxymethylpyrimidine pyrophosphatase-like HAD family hydrolase